MIRTVIVDDDLGLRLVTRMFAEEEGCVVIGEAETGEQAVRLVMRRAPDLVVMDYRMNGMDGVQATRHILAARPGVAVVGWTCDDDPAIAEAFVAAGACAHAVKGEFDALRSVLRGVRDGQPASA